MRNERGITLVALVVTIVIILILAGITIAFVTGPNGIIEQAKNAKDKYLEIAKLIQENPSLEVMTLVDIHSISDDYDLPVVGCISVEKEFVYQPDGEYLYFENNDLEDYIYDEIEEKYNKISTERNLSDCEIDLKVKNRIEELKKSGEIKEYIIVRIGD
jgi:type II secretory pathway pseudopilin PulG